MLATIHLHFLRKIHIVAAHTAGGEKIMEVLTGGLRIHENTIETVNQEVARVSKRFHGLTLQVSSREHSQQQAGKFIKTLEKVVATMTNETDQRSKESFYHWSYRWK